ncbi:MAG: CBS domain-containing protein [Deltaproteobacteria bacterium]|nr:CBS domain-containing protein [Deltaproteobacteria bacterium]
MNVKELIREGNHTIYSIGKDGSVAEAIEQLVEHEIGALIVTDNGKPVGVFSERDVLTTWVRKGDRMFRDIKVQEVMTGNMIVVEPKDDLCYVMNVMVKNRIRHLPVVEDHHLVGVLSIRDVVKTQVTNLQAENHYLKEYITDKYPG